MGTETTLPPCPCGCHDPDCGMIHFQPCGCCENLKCRPPTDEELKLFKNHEWHFDKRAIYMMGWSDGQKN